MFNYFLVLYPCYLVFNFTKCTCHFELALCDKWLRYRKRQSWRSAEKFTGLDGDFEKWLRICLKVAAMWFIEVISILTP